MLREALVFACVPLGASAVGWFATRAACSAAPRPASTGDVINFLAPEAIFGAFGEPLVIALGTVCAVAVALTPLRGPLPGWAAQAIAWLPATAVLLLGSPAPLLGGPAGAMPLVTTWAMVTAAVAAVAGLMAGSWARMDNTESGGLARHLARVDVCDRAREEGLFALHRDIQRFSPAPCPPEAAREACDHAAWRALEPGDREALEDALRRWADMPRVGDMVFIVRATLRDAGAL